MENKKLKLDFEATIFDVVDLNKSFAAAKCEVCYTGRNRNMSDISKTAIESAMPSIKNIPVVGRYDVDKGDFGGHDLKVVSNENGISIENATVPFGVVPESANQWFETKIVNGVEKECFFTDVILWKRQHGYDRIVNAGTIGESMEINVNAFSTDNEGYCVIDNFEFEALCILGDDVTPCFENASIQMYSKEIISDFQLQFSEMLKEFKELNNNEDNCLTNTGGDLQTMDEKMAVLEKFNKTIEDLDFSIEEMSVEELSQKMEELFSEPVNNEPVIETDPVVENFENQDKPVVAESFSATYRQKRDALDKALTPIFIKNGEGDVIDETYFWLRDFDDTYVYVEKSHWYVGGYDCENGRFSYTFDETTVEATITGEFEQMYQVWLTAEEKAAVDAERANFEALTEQFNTLQTEFDTYKENYSTENTVVAELSAYKVANEANAVFAKYASSIGETKEFGELKENYMNYTVAELEKECIYIRGLHAETAVEPQSKPITFSVIPETKEEKPYGGIFEKYLNK